LRLVFAVAAVLLVLGAAAPIVAQTGVDIPKGTKSGPEEPETMHQRLLDGWREAALVAGEGSGPEGVAETLVAMIHQSIKDVGLGSLEAEELRALKASVALAEGRVRSLAGALSRHEIDEAAARTAVQRALDEYLSISRAFLEARVTPSPGSHRR
jgi:hypothetical protein